MGRRDRGGDDGKEAGRKAEGRKTEGRKAGRREGRCSCLCVTLQKLILLYLTSKERIKTSVYHP